MVRLWPKKAKRLFARGSLDLFRGKIQNKIALDYWLKVFQPNRKDNRGACVRYGNFLLRVFQNKLSYYASLFGKVIT